MIHETGAVHRENRGQKLKFRSGIPIAPHARALLFDCDGTLADSMAAHMAAWEAAFAACGESVPESFLVPLRGMDEVSIVRHYNQVFGRGLDAGTVLEIKHKHYLEHLETVKPIAPVVGIVNLPHGRPMAVVSGGIRRIVLVTLEAIGLAGRFQALITAEDVSLPKPAPDGFLEAARRLSVDPVHCQVFEDGDLGIEAARSAGMHATDVRPYL